MKNETTNDTAYFGGGCFWCTEAVFSHIIGVTDVISGYSGGETGNPTYEDVCTGTTGHAETSMILFDSTVISYTELLNIFFAFHDPTSLNRQGADIGTQYRSVIFYRNPEQQKLARECIQKLEAEDVFDKPIVTQVVPFNKFYKAEPEHQDYYEKHPNAGYCTVVISPKVAKIRKKFSSKFRE